LALLFLFAMLSKLSFARQLGTYQKNFTLQSFTRVAARKGKALTQ
jgi:hypothetical protein